MLCDPKWETKIKPDVFSLESLIAWLEKQNPKAEYDFWCTKCLLGRYFIQNGFDVLMVGTATITVRSGKSFDLPPRFNDISMDEPRTYGAALSRARALSPGALNGRP